MTDSHYHRGRQTFQDGTRVVEDNFTSEQWREFKHGFQDAAKEHYDMELRKAEPSEHEKLGLLAGGQGRTGEDIVKDTAIMAVVIFAAIVVIVGVFTGLVLHWTGVIQ